MWSWRRKRSIKVSYKVPVDNAPEISLYLSLVYQVLLKYLILEEECDTIVEKKRKKCWL